jgi:transposase
VFVGRRGHPPESRRKVLDLVEAGRPVVDVPRDLGVCAESIDTWRRQDRTDKGLQPGLTSAEKAELAAATHRIAEFETELAIHRRAAVMAGEGVPVHTATRALGVAGSGCLQDGRALLHRPFTPGDRPVVDPADGP